ncbi:MAG: ion channel [Pseudomonadota bacterium]
MVLQLIVGTAMLAFTIGIGALAIIIAARALNAAGFTGGERLSVMMHTFVITLVTSSLALVLILIMALWAGLFVALGIFPSFEPALYIAMISATTLGYGDVTLPSQWRLLAGFIATDGFILFGLDTAFLFEVMRRLGDPSLMETPNG